jgi:hypothetical protein
MRSQCLLRRHDGERAIGGVCSDASLAGIGGAVNSLFERMLPLLHCGNCDIAFPSGLQAREAVK